MSGGAHRNADKVNIIGIVVIGICSAVMVYVSIIALQAFYSNDSSDVQTMADYGGQDTIAKTLRADQTRNITEPKSNGKAGTYSINIKDAMTAVVADLKKPGANPAVLVPSIGPSTKPTNLPIFGRPKTITGTGSGSAAGSAAPADAGSGSAAAGSGSGSSATPPAAPTSPTGPTGAGAGSNG